MKKILVVFVALLVLTSSDLFAQQKLSLEKAISIALQRNSSLIKTKNSINTYEANVKSSYGDLLPDLGLRGSWNWSKTQDDGGTQLDFFGNPHLIPSTTNDSRSYSLSPGGSVLLFNGLANYANIDQKESNPQGAK
ncbi:MAG: TolC family protein, partial [Melioribacteraceae bacterium]|nr:TolC family protein [Melioribacteraceae bacterium]